jgi:hypothetical protein
LHQLRALGGDRRQPDPALASLLGVEPGSSFGVGRIALQPLLVLPEQRICERGFLAG